MRKVLFPTKFEALSLSCVERLYPLKRAGLEEIVFLFVIDRDEVAFNLFTGFDEKLAGDLKEEARLRFEDWSRAVEAQGIRCRHVVEIGRPEGKILEVGSRESVDLIVTGRQKHLAADAVYLGGTAMGVLRRATVPVLVCKHPSPEESSGEDSAANVFENVLYATDFSEESERALGFISALGGAIQRVDVVHVMTERDFRKHTEEEVRAEEAAYRERLEQICRDLGRDGLEAQAHLLAGHTSSEILHAAADRHSTLVVMGTKGRHGVQEIWLGSASHRVAELCAVPVLLVPAAQRDD